MVKLLPKLLEAYKPPNIDILLAETFPCAKSREPVPMVPGVTAP